VREPKNLTELNKNIRASQPLVPGAKKAVLGEGPIGAAIAFVGEQPEIKRIYRGARSSDPPANC
jgi:uracil-DNA glycosylase